MCSNHITHYYRHPGLTKSTVENILRKLQRDVTTAITDVDSELCFNLDLICPFSSEESEVRCSMCLTSHRIDYEILIE